MQFITASVGTTIGTTIGGVHMRIEAPIHWDVTVFVTSLYLIYFVLRTA